MIARRRDPARGGGALRWAIIFTTAVSGTAGTGPAHGQAFPPPTLRYTPECDIRRGSSLLQDEMGRYLLRNTTRPGVRYLDTELRQRLEATALSLSMALLVRDLFDDRALPVRLPIKSLSLAYADELQALRRARRLTAANDAKAFWSVASQRSTVYEFHCQVKE